jgi:assimilatory nitrate reductase catalytic subunit
VNLKRVLGLDTLADRYAYAEDAVAGYTSAKRVPDRWVPTTCGYCSVGCGMFIGVKNGRAVGVRGNPDHPVNVGVLCPKGLSEHETIHATGRATHPLFRPSKKSKLYRVGWTDAIQTMAARFRDVQRRHGNNAVGIISTGQLVTEEFYTRQAGAARLGTRNYDGNTTPAWRRPCRATSDRLEATALPELRGSRARGVILLIGANIADNHPILWQRLEANPSKTLIVVDPRVTKTAMLADLHLPVKPRSDLALINGIIHILIESDLIDHAYIDEHTEGFEPLYESVKEYRPERVSEITGLSVELIYRVASLYGNAKAAFIAWTMGVNHSSKGTETVNAINNLALITGNIGRAGAAPFSITGQCNAMGTREAGFTSSLPGYRKFEDTAEREALATIWNVPVDRIPTKRGLAYPDIIEAVLERKIRALWIIATNPIVSFPNLGVLQQALETLEFLVVQDGFHPTPTTALADLVLPAAIWGEKEGTYTNAERRVSKVNKAVEPPGEARSDFQIFLDVAAALGCRDELFPNWKTPEDAFEWKRVSAGRLCDYSSMSRSHRGEGRHAVGRREALHSGQFQTDNGSAADSTKWELFAEPPNRDYPFVLNTGRTVEHWHTRTKTGRVPILERLSPRPWLEMNPRDGRALGLHPTERVDVVSRRGTIRNLDLRLTETVVAGQVFVPFHWAEANANQATQSDFDPISREPNYKQCAVRVERSR